MKLSTRSRAVGALAAVVGVSGLAVLYKAAAEMSYSVGVLKGLRDFGGVAISAMIFGVPVQAVLGSGIVLLQRERTGRWPLLLMVCFALVSLVVLALEWRFLAFYGHGRLSGPAL